MRLETGAPGAAAAQEIADRQTDGSREATFRHTRVMMSTVARGLARGSHLYVPRPHGTPLAKGVPMAAYSMDLRTRVLEDSDTGLAKGPIVSLGPVVYVLRPCRRAAVETIVRSLNTGRPSRSYLRAERARLS